MKVLIISFDKSLSEKLKQILSKKHEVFTAKNTEEALTLVPPEIDVIVFDAISGAISEEEINQLYNKKFSNQRYIILYDELFPVDENNIQPPNKVLVIRDNALEEVPKLIEGEIPAETTQPPHTSQKQELITEPQIPEVQEIPTPKPEQEVVSRPTGKPKILIVSFDKKLTDELEELLKGKYDIEVVKNQRLVKEKGRTADLIVYDAISGTIAEKNLMDLAEDPVLREKYYLILMDDLFPINVDKINLPNKEVVNRDAPATLIAEQIEDILRKASPTGGVSQTESSPMQETPATSATGEEELIQGNVIEFATETPREVVEEKPKAEEPITAGTSVPSEEYTSYTPPPKEQPPPSVPENVSLLIDDKTIKAAIVEAISNELAGLREEIKREVTEYIKDAVASVIREEVEKYLLELRIPDLIREETRKIVEQKLKELLE